MVLQKPKEGMDREERLKSKILYKILLYLMKVIPMVMAFVSILNTVLSYANIDLPILSYIVSNSLLTIIYFYISSYVFKFCLYYRMFIHYNTLIWLLNIYDYYIGVPVNDRGMLSIYIIITVICLFILLYLHVKNNKKLTDENS